MYFDDFANKNYPKNFFRVLPYISSHHYIFLIFAHKQGNGRPNALSSLIDAEKRKRNRTFIDPVSEVPRLEDWFLQNTHPSHAMIARYTDELNLLPYRQKFPKLEQKNVQFWFKNRRAKCKRLNNCLWEFEWYAAMLCNN